MGGILSTILLTLGSYMVQPDWFDNGPYEYFGEYQTLSECQIATHGTDDVCVGESPVKQFIKSNETNTTYQETLTWVECDYWAGCYWGKR